MGLRGQHNSSSICAFCCTELNYKASEFKRVSRFQFLCHFYFSFLAIKHYSPYPLWLLTIQVSSEKPASIDVTHHRSDKQSNMFRSFILFHRVLKFFQKDTLLYLATSYQKREFNCYPSSSPADLLSLSAWIIFHFAKASFFSPSRFKSFLRSVVLLCTSPKTKAGKVSFHHHETSMSVIPACTYGLSCLIIPGHR